MLYGHADNSLILEEELLDSPCAGDWMSILINEAGKLHRMLPFGMNEEDLYTPGWAVMERTLINFDPERKVPKERWVRFRVRGAMIDEMRRGGPMSRDRWKKCREGGPGKGGWVLGYEGLYKDSEDGPLGRWADGVYYWWERGEGERVLQDELWEALTRKLSKRDVVIAEALFRQEMNLREAGSLVGLSESRIHQIRLELRDYMAKKLEELGGIGQEPGVL